MDDVSARTSGTGFETPDRLLADLSAANAARLLETASDVTLILDSEGTVLDRAFRDPAIWAAGGNNWTGRPWAETVTRECVDKIDALVAVASAGKTAGPREINHAMPHGDDVPVVYVVAPLDEPGAGGLLIACGRDITRLSQLQQKLMRSQLSVEREFERLRAAEGRYRAIFHNAETAQVVIDAETLAVTDANAAALRLLGRNSRQAQEVRIAEFLGGDDAAVLHKILNAAISDDGAKGATTIVAAGGRRLSLSVARFRQERRHSLLLTLSPESAEVLSFVCGVERSVLDIVEAMPDAFVVANAKREILAANAAFVDLLELSGPHDAIGRPIDDWFERPGVDAAVLMTNVREHGVVRRFATVVRGQYERREPVEIAAVQIQGSVETVIGFSIRSVSALAPHGVATEDTGLPRSSEQITNLVGHAPLKDIVRETTEIIEKLCIDTALELTRGNRALAAQMLGLSRQSLYSKLGPPKQED